MAQVFRLYKYEIPMIIRYYGINSHQQRSKFNYYEALNISPNATQKEIKEAYIKLSKKMHPDSGTEGSHKEFVKINEAYTILSKSDTKENYDNNLKCNYTYTPPPYKKNSSSSSQRSQFTYEEWGFVHPSKHVSFSEESRQKGVIMCLIIMFLGAIIQIFLIEKSFVFKRYEMLKRSQKYEAEYNKIKEDAKNKSLEEQIQKLYDLHRERQAKLNGE